MIVYMDEAARSYRLDEMVDAEEFGEMAGVQRLTIHAYRKQPDKYGLPEPCVYAAGVPLWHRENKARVWIENRKGQGTGGGRAAWRTAG